MSDEIIHMFIFSSNVFLYDRKQPTQPEILTGNNSSYFFVRFVSNIKSQHACHHVLFTSNN